jgi:hypothetical protein
MFAMLAAAAVVVVIALVVSIGSRGRHQEPSKPVTPASTTTTPVNPAVDRATARAAVLRASDLRGYQPRERTKAGDMPASARAAFARCLNADVTLFEKMPGAQDADSPAFMKQAADYSTSAAISNSVEIAPQESNVAAEFEAITGSRGKPCVARLFQAAFQKLTSAHVPLPTVARFDLDLGDRAVGYMVPADNSGKPDNVYYELLFVQRGRASVTFFNTTIGRPVDRELTLALARTVLGRLGRKTS